MLKSANVQLLLCRTLCPGKFLLMLGGDVGAVQQAIAAGTARAGEMLVDSRCWPTFTQRTTGDQRSQRGRAAAGGGIVETGAWRRASAPPTAR